MNSIIEKLLNQWVEITGYDENQHTFNLLSSNYAFNRAGKRIQEELGKKVEEIIASSDYRAKIEEIANELVDYSINGYKEDMKDRIRQRLVGNVLDLVPYYGELSLVDLIHQEINKRMYN